MKIQKPQRVLPKEIREATYTVLVENEPGVLSRIAGLFSARGYNISSLAVGETQDPSMSRMTVVAQGTETVIEQIGKQLDKLIPVIRVENLKIGEFVSRELMIIKLTNSLDAKAFIQQKQDEHQWKILSEESEGLVVEAVVASGEASAVIDELRPYGISEISRSGQIAMATKQIITVS